MATAKRKTKKKRKATKRSRAAAASDLNEALAGQVDVRSFAATDLEQILRNLNLAAHPIVVAIEAAREGKGGVPQELLRLGYLFAKVSKVSEEMSKAVLALLLEAHADNRKCETEPLPGCPLVVATFGTTKGKVAPSWKTEYLALVEKALGKAFDEETEVEKVKDRTEPSPDRTNVKLSEAG